MASGQDQSGGEGGGGSSNFNLTHGGYNEILQFAVTNTPEDGSREPEARAPLTEEKKEFLNKVFNEMLRDDAKEMKKQLEILTSLQGSRDEENEEKMQESLEILLDLCDTIDNAQDFLKVGGVNVAMDLLKDPNPEIRWRALDVLAASTQNNPMNQNSLVEREALKVFLKMLDEDSSNQVRVKALYAVSCLVRESELAQESFVNENGFSSLMRAMQTDIEKLQIKAAFLLSKLVWEQPKFSETLHNMGMVQQLIYLLRSEQHEYHEHVVHAILNLVSQHRGCRQDSLTPELDFRALLEEKLKSLKGKDEYLEEYEYCQKLMEIYSKESNQNDADR